MNNQDPLDRYSQVQSRKYDEDDIPYVPEHLAKPPDEDPLEKYKPSEKTEPGLLGQLPARVVETVGGSVGNLKQMLQQVALGMYETYEPHIFPSGKAPEKVREAPQWFKSAIGIGKPKGPGDFPTSQELREEVTQPIAKQLFGDKEALEPKNQTQKFFNELTEDVTGFLLPGSGKIKTWKKVSIPVTTDLAKEGLKYTGLVKPETADKAKLGLMLAFDIAHRGNAGKFASSKFEEARASLPPNTVISTIPSIQKLYPIWQNLQSGLGTLTPSKKKAAEAIEQFMKKAKTGQINGHEMMDAIHDLNELRDELGMFAMPHKQRQKTVKHFEDINKAMKENLYHYADQQNPLFGKLYREANEAFAVNAKSNYISKFIDKNYGKPFLSEAAQSLFKTGGALGTLGGSTYLLGLPKTLGILAPSAAIYKTVQIFDRISSSPVLSRYYQGVIGAAAKGNTKLMSMYMQKLDHGLAEDERKIKRKFKKLDIQQEAERTLRQKGSQ